MKKIIAIVLCLAVLCTLSVSAFAEASKSPEKPEKLISIILRAAIGVEGVTSADTVLTFKVGEAKFTVKVDPNRGKFDNWSIYKVVDGKAVPATLEDYALIEGSLNDVQIKVEAKTDIIVCANYNGVITDPNSPSGPSPKTADNSIVFVAIAMLAAAAVAFSAKKALSK